MSMNRQQKRMLQKQGEVDADGAPVRQRRQQPSAGAPVQERTSPGQFLREVRGELRKVAWPSRSETINYSIVVLVTIVFMGALIYGLDWLFSTFILELFEQN